MNLTWSKIESSATDSFSSWDVLIIIPRIDDAINGYVLLFSQGNIWLLLRSHKVDIVCPVVHFLTVVSRMLLRLLLSLRADHRCLLIEIHDSTSVRITHNAYRFVVSNMSWDRVNIVIQDERPTRLVTRLMGYALETWTVRNVISSIRHRSCSIGSKITRLVKAIVLECFGLILVISLRL